MVFHGNIPSHQDHAEQCAKKGCQAPDAMKCGHNGPLELLLQNNGAGIHGYVEKRPGNAKQEERK